jgi:hypothetical protein
LDRDRNTADRNRATAGRVLPDRERHVP